MYLKGIIKDAKELEDVYKRQTFDDRRNLKYMREKEFIFQFVSGSLRAVSYTHLGISILYRFTGRKKCIKVIVTHKKGLRKKSYKKETANLSGGKGK